jgi:ribonuclease Z
MEPRSIFWNTVKNLPGTPWTISGYSRAAYRSAFYVTGINVMLDAGPQSFKRPEHILITHTHGDHIAELPFTLIRKIIPGVAQSPPTKQGGERKISIYCPKKAEPYIRKYISQLFCTNALDDVFRPIIDETYDLITIPQERSSRRVIMNNQIVELETVGADHSIDTVIYCISLVKEKLNPKYAGISGKELVLLKKSGECITIEIVDKKFCYVLDTSIKTFEQNVFLFEYPVIIVECTFLLDGEIELAVEKKHIHWQQLKPYIINNPTVTFILTHFSLRYKDSEIKDFFDNITIKENITNIIPWLTDCDADMVKISKQELQELQELRAIVKTSMGDLVTN